MKFDDARKLQQKKFRTQSGHFLVEGEHLILELQKAAETYPEFSHSTLFVTERQSDIKTSFPTRIINERQMKQISGTQSPQGIIAAVPFPEKRPAQPGEQAIYLHEVQDPGNLGTIIRTLGWFGGFRLLLSPNSVDPYNPKVVRSSMGAIFHVPMEFDVDLMSLPHRFRNIATLDMHGEHMSHSSFRGCDCYVFGNEARGVPRAALETIDPHTFTINGCGAIESLNLATAVNMAAYEINRL